MVILSNFKNCINYVINFFSLPSPLNLKPDFFVDNLFWKWLILLRPINLFELLFSKGKKIVSLKYHQVCFSSPSLVKKRHYFFSSVWSVCKIIRNKLMRWEGRVVPTFDFSVLQRGFWWGLCSTFPVASQTFLFLFCQVTEPRGSVQPHRVKHSMLISLMGHLLDWHLPANKGLKEGVNPTPGIRNSDLSYKLLSSICMEISVPSASVNLSSVDFYLFLFLAPHSEETLDALTLREVCLSILC